MTDQDNALVFENVEEEQYESVKSYFLNFDTKVMEKINSISVKNVNFCI